MDESVEFSGEVEGKDKPVWVAGRWEFGDTGVKLTPVSDQKFWLIDFEPDGNIKELSKGGIEEFSIMAGRVKMFARGMIEAVKMLEGMKDDRPVEMSGVTNPRMADFLVSSLGKENVNVILERGGGSRRVSIDVEKLLNDNEVRVKLGKIAKK